MKYDIDSADCNAIGEALSEAVAAARRGPVDVCSLLLRAADQLDADGMAPLDRVVRDIAEGYSERATAATRRVPGE